LKFESFLKSHAPLFWLFCCCAAHRPAPSRNLPPKQHAPRAARGKQTAARYANLAAGAEEVESTLHVDLIGQLMPELVLGTVRDVSMAVAWLRTTFLAVRARAAPRRYGLPAAAPTDQQARMCAGGGGGVAAAVGSARERGPAAARSLAPLLPSPLSLSLVSAQALEFPRTVQT